jgi:hypothetical protein
MRRRSPRSNDRLRSTDTEAIPGSLTLIANESQLRIQVGPPDLRLDRGNGRAVGFEAVDPDQLPPQIRLVLKYLDGAVRTREPAIRARVERLRAVHPHLTSEQLARELIRSTRRRVAATGALSGAASIAPGIGTALAIGTITSQTLYALEQEVELVLGIAKIYGHALAESDDRVLEALVVVGITSGAVKLREDVIVAGGERLAIAAFRRVPGLLLRHGGGRLLTRILTRVGTTGGAKLAARVVPLGVGVGLGAGFDWVAVTALGRAAMRYYGPGGPGARPFLLAPEDPSNVELGH